MDNPTKYKVLLASNSPRRRQLLGYIVPDFEIAPSRDVDEVYSPDTKPEDVAPVLSALKAEAYTDLAVGDTMVITADTVVILDDKILGKPKSRQQAVDMIMSLAGRSHKVVTGVTLTAEGKRVTFAETTHVVFDELSRDEVERYVDEYRPYDKAGAYGIQEWVGCAGIRGVDGCFYNVMGLPLHSLYKHLKSF